MNNCNHDHISLRDDEILGNHLVCVDCGRRWSKPSLPHDITQDASFIGLDAYSEAGLLDAIKARVRSQQF